MHFSHEVEHFVVFEDVPGRWWRQRHGHLVHLNIVAAERAHETLHLHLIAHEIPEGLPPHLEVVRVGLPTSKSGNSSNTPRPRAGAHPRSDATAPINLST